MKREKETMTTGYYIAETSAEREAIARWENEGGRVRQGYDYAFDSAREVLTRAGLTRILNYEAIDCGRFGHFGRGAR